MSAIAESIIFSFLLITAAGDESSLLRSNLVNVSSDEDDSLENIDRGFFSAHLRPARPAHLVNGVTPTTAFLDCFFVLVVDRTVTLFVVFMADRDKLVHLIELTSSSMSEQSSSFYV